MDHRLRRQKLWHPKSYKDLIAHIDPKDILYQSGGRLVVRTDPGVVIKAGGDFAEEVLCARFAREELSLPVPRILHYTGSARRRIPWTLPNLIAMTNDVICGVWFFCMEEVPGVSLDKVIDTLPQTDLDHIGLQLRDLVRKIASAQGQALGSITGHPYRNFPFRPFYQPQMAFSNFGDFRAYIRTLLEHTQCISDSELEQLLHTIPRNASIRFAHGDLLPKNIMVNGSTVTGIIDWGYAGFFPDFWEYCRMHDPLFMTPGWERVLATVFPGEHRQAEIDAVRRMLDLFAFL